MLCLCYTITLPAQELSGTWRGYFIPNNELEGRVYNYEVEIQENQSHQLTVITYTSSSGNSSSNFSAKALGNGFHSVNTNLVSIVETKFDGLNLASNQQACLMTNYLTYSNGGEALNNCLDKFNNVFDFLNSLDNIFDAIEKLERMHPSTPDYSVVYNHLEIGRAHV